MLVRGVVRWVLTNESRLTAAALRARGEGVDCAPAALLASARAALEGVGLGHLAAAQPEGGKGGLRHGLWPAGADALLRAGEWAGRLSAGEGQRLALARLLFARPAYAFLDEATSALDVPAEVAVLQALRCAGIGLAVVSHRMRDAVGDAVGD